jgi:hypothetical protein
MCGLDSYGPGKGPVTGSCNLSNEASGSIKGGEFLDQLGDYQHLTDYGAWS